MSGEIYFGAPGALIQIPHPRGGIQSTRIRPAATFNTASGGARTGKTISGKRKYTLNWTQLWYETYAQLLAYEQGHMGPGPFVLHDPGQTNWLTANQAGATSVTNDGSNFTVATSGAPVFVGASSVVATDNAATSCQLPACRAGDLILMFCGTRATSGTIPDTPDGYTRLGGFAATDNVAIFAKRHSGTETSQPVAPSGGTSGDTFLTFSLGYRNIALPDDLADLVTASEQIPAAAGQDFLFAGVDSSATASNIVLMVGLKADDFTSVTPPSGFTEAVEASSTTGSDASMYVAHLLQSAGSLVGGGTATVTGGASASRRSATIVLTGTTAPTGMLSSQATTYYRGPRSLQVSPTAFGLVHLVKLDAPTANWPGIPCIASQALTFSCQLRSAGPDDDLSVRGRLAWYNTAGTLLTPSDTGTYAVTDAGWQALSLTATPPAGAAYVQPQLIMSGYTGLARDDAGLTVFGTSGHYISTPDTAVLDIVGDIDLRVDLAYADWSSGGVTSMLAKWGTAGQRSYELQHDGSGGHLILRWSTNGTTIVTQSSSTGGATTGDLVTDGGRLAIRATLDVDNGAGGYTVRFYTASTIAGPWTQFGSSFITVAGTTSIFAGTQELSCGGSEGGTVGFTPAQFFAAGVYSGISGTAVANPDFAARPSGTAAFADTAGRTWTPQGSLSRFVGWTELYVDQLQLERGSAVTGWRPGTGVGPVAVQGLNEQWPWQASDYRESPVLVLQETGP